MMAARYAEAEVAFEQVTAREPDNVAAWHKKGNALLKQGKYKKALRAYEKALKLDQTSVHVWFKKGLALEALGRHEEALKSLKRVTVMKPHHGMAREYRGDAFCELGRYEEALKAYNQALERFSPKANASIAQVQSSKGIALEKLGRDVEAMTMLVLATRTHPRSANAWFNLAVMQKKMDNPNQAMKTINIALTQDPKHGPAQEFKKSLPKDKK